MLFKLGSKEYIIIIIIPIIIIIIIIIYIIISIIIYSVSPLPYELVVLEHDERLSLSFRHETDGVLWRLYRCVIERLRLLLHCRRSVASLSDQHTSSAWNISMDRMSVLQ